MKFTEVFVVANDVQLTAVDRLDQASQRQLQAEKSDFVVSRAMGQRYSKVIDSETAAMLGEFTHGATIVDAILQYCRTTSCDPEETLHAALSVLEELIRAQVLVAEDSYEPAPVAASHIAKHEVTNPFSPRERLLAHYVHRLDPAGPLFEAGLPEPPRSSINYGSGGVAYFFYRLACIREDSRLLSWAKLWIEKAIQESETQQFAFSDADGIIPPEVIGRVALYHSPTGLYALKALIGHASHDQAAQVDGLAGFVNAAQSPCDNIDLTLGTSGVLLGAALLDEAIPGQPDVRSLGARLLADIWDQLDAMPQIADEKGFSATGIAHGWAGVLYAVLTWCQSTGAPLPATLPERLHQLAGLAEPWGNGMRWTKYIRSPSDHDPTSFSAGWCNGTAGMIHLWTRAHEALNDIRFLTLAEEAARNVIEAPEPIVQLCCGRPGQAYAMLNLYKRSGDPLWLNHAHEFAQQSLRLSQLPADFEAPSLHYSLYRGGLGTALLLADIDEPSEACMPLFERENWQPARNVLPG